MNPNPRMSVQGYYFPLSEDIYDTLNSALYKLQLIIISEYFAEHPPAGSYSKCIWTLQKYSFFCSRVLMYFLKDFTINLLSTLEVSAT